MHRQQPGLLLRRAGLLRERLACARQEKQRQVLASSSPSPSSSRASPITTVARTPEVQIETAPGDSRPQGAMLMRDFLRASLYDPDRGYFSRPLPPVGSLPEPIDFSKLVGQAEYRAVLARAHSSRAAAAAAAAGGGDDSNEGASAAAGAADAGRLLGGGDWLTPAEIFRPWYGAAVAHYVLEAHALEEGRRRQQQKRQAEAAAAAAAGSGSSSSSSSSNSRREGQQQQPPVAAVNKKLTPMLHHDRAPLTAAGADPAAALTAAEDDAAAATAAAPANNHHTPLDTPLYIVEIGGGTGALALSVLDYIRAVAPPGVYDRTTYVCVEVSAPLAARQHNAVAVEGGHARAFASVLGDATERSTWDAVGRAVPGMPVVMQAAVGKEDEKKRGGGNGGSGGNGGGGLPSSSSLADDSPPPRVFVLAMEVLDNLPHDRIERAAPGQPWLQTAVAPKSPRAAARLPSSSSRGGWGGGGSERQQKQQQQQQQQQWRQVLQPVTDPLVAGCARVFLPLMASAAGGDAASPAVLAGIGGGEEGEGGEEEEDDGADGGRGFGADAPTSPAPTPAPAWGWDPATWLRRLLAAATGEQLDPVAAWLPTGCLSLLRCLHGALPARHTLVASDFDALPGVQVEGHGAPIVSGRTVKEEEGEDGGGGGSDGEESGGDEGGRGEGGRRRRALLRRRLVARDHAGVLVPWGTADIFFPTDFDALSALYASAAASSSEANETDAAAAADARSAPAARAPSASSPSPSSPSSPLPAAATRAACQHMPTADFMAAFAESKRTRTLSGYNPLLQDFKNTRFFIGEARRAEAAGRS